MNLLIEITVPVLNEEKTLHDQVHKICRFVRSELVDFGSVSIVLADNGSTDKTPELARVLCQELEEVQYLRLEQRGVGRALKASWTKSEADIVGYMDLDLATDLRYLRPALEKLCGDHADIVTGSRLAKGASVIGRKLLRSFTSRCFNLIIKAVFRTSFSDGMCGFKFLKRSVLKELMGAGAQSDGWFFATEILIVSEYLGYRLDDLPVEWTDDPDSKVKIQKLAMEYLKAMCVLRGRLPKRINGV